MDRPTDELVHHLLTAINAHGGAHAARLIDEARAEAQAEVKDLLKTAMKAVLLRRAVGQLAGSGRAADAPPPAPPEATGPAACYVYAITAAAWGRPPPTVRGLDPDAPLRVTRHDDLQAITGPVSLAEFGPDVINDRLQDLAWVEQKVRAHDAAVKALSALGTAIPCRFCTILPAEEDARAALARHADAIRQTLHRIDGKKEWGVKLLADTRATGAPALSCDDEPPSADPGRAYLLQKKRSGSRRDDVLRAAADAAEICHRELSALATDAALLPTRDRRGSRGWHLALNAAYLVRSAGNAPFHARVEALSRQFRPHGLRLDLTGPWPPYNFAALEFSEAAP
jgi:hypothetical protein